jgi:hypothetical protein
MTKGAASSGGRRITRKPPSRLPRLKLFRPINWREGSWFSSTDKFISHILMELGRLGLEVSAIERYDRAPNTKTVLSDLIGWLSERPEKPFF